MFVMVFDFEPQYFIRDSAFVLRMSGLIYQWKAETVGS